MPGWNPTRTVKWLVGTVWSGLWVILGLWLMENTSLILGVGPLSAGLFVFLALVADDMVPGASPTLTNALKLTTMLVFFEWAPILILSQ